MGASTIENAAAATVVGQKMQQQAKLGKYKRKLTEARREQNRRSQRVWREKQKQRRDEEVKAKVQEELKRLGQINGLPPQSPRAGSDLVRPHELRVEGGIVCQPQPLPFVEPQRDHGVNGTSLSSTESVVTPEPALPEPALPLPVAVYYYVPPDPDSEDMRHIWDGPTDTEYKTYKLPPGYSSLCPTGPISPRSRFSSLPSSSQRKSHTSSNSHLPSPYLNHLQLVGESCFGATLSIAQSLGITRSSYINDHPSPFTTSSNANIHTVPVDFRPTAFQLILPHPCFLDCIPFAHFRSMAIYLSSVKKLDHCSLFLDLMHDGMVCWGRANANGHFGRSMRDGVAWSKRSWEVRKWFWRKWGWIARMRVEDIDSGFIAQRDEEVFDDEDGMLSGSQWWWSLHGDQEGMTPSPPAEDPADLNAVVAGIPEQEEQGAILSRQSTCHVGLRHNPDLIVHWPEELN
ncbi:uncharacterized protein Z518_00389 [Rhinocladiella mackenziei CBS 650.93]|uniref:BZIP domain-containing protein n=1 Tax=Rhinocladiella mackenziei CBS 650.93 TaxID=1442369 RepID=A0A0D2JIP8_9EURO|nr:uncharacterized protein Z518_00389 [Rhinocladiella mackenziei CBS 650.93]KIX09310.1 hypothetical protein Z518_00389 [Rhinocladiella mackenziei CBS 650.93]